MAVEIPPEIRERLKAAEQVCVLLSWTGTAMDSAKGKALHELWKHWVEVSGVDTSPQAHPELGAQRIAELAAKRDATRAQMLAIIRNNMNGGD